MENNNSWYLVEDFQEDFNYSGKRILALTPESCFGLQKKGIEYSIIEDFYDEKVLVANEDQYFEEQLQWINKFDEMFRSNIPYCKNKDIFPAYIHIYQLKGFIDSLIINSRILQKFFERESPGSIVYLAIPKQGNLKADIYDLYHNRRDFLFSLVQEHCRKQNVELTTNIEKKQNIRINNHRITLCESHFKTLRKCLKSIYFMFKYGKPYALLKRKEFPILSILFLHAGCTNIDSLIKDMISGGHRVFLKNGSKVQLISSFWQPQRLDLTDLSNQDIAEGCKKVSVEFSRKGGLIDWVSEKSGIDISELVRPYLRDFIENTCYRSLTELQVLEDFYKANKIDFVVSRTSSEKETVSALMAAKKTHRRVCLQHSCSAFNFKPYLISELGLFDFYFAMHDEAERHMRNEAEKCFANCRVYQAPYHIKQIKKRWGRVRRNPKTILYIPRKLLAGYRFFNGDFYPLTWYFKLQRTLLDIFGYRKDLRFIYKIAQGQDWARDSLLFYIKDKKYTNITIVDKRIEDCLGVAGKAILDNPSTGLYEVAAAGVPVICLYRRDFKVREEARRLFGDSLQPFFTIDEAAGIISAFLDSPALDYRPAIGFTQTDPVKILLGIKNES